MIKTLGRWLSPIHRTKQVINAGDLLSLLSKLTSRLGNASSGMQPPAKQWNQRPMRLGQTSLHDVTFQRVIYGKVERNQIAGDVHPLRDCRA